MKKLQYKRKQGHALVILSNIIGLMTLLMFLSVGSAPLAAADLPRTDQTATTLIDSAYDQSCRIDFTNKLTAPAGGLGYLGVGADGHFHWADGRRARFWGVNIS